MARRTAPGRPAASNANRLRQRSGESATAFRRRRAEARRGASGGARNRRASTAAASRSSGS